MAFQMILRRLGVGATLRMLHEGNGVPFKEYGLCTTRRQGPFSKFDV